MSRVVPLAHFPLLLSPGLIPFPTYWPGKQTNPNFRRRVGLVSAGSAAAARRRRTSGPWTGRRRSSASTSATTPSSTSPTRSSSRRPPTRRPRKVTSVRACQGASGAHGSAHAALRHASRLRYRVQRRMPSMRVFRGAAACLGGLSRGRSPGGSSSGRRRRRTR
jgi:hypothetical protein